MINKIYATWIYVSNIDRSLDFYQNKIGLKFKLRDGEWIEFDLGETSFAILERPIEKDRVAPQKTRIMFEVNDIVQYKVLMLNSGIKLIGDIRTESYGKLLTFEDPDGHWLELYEAKKIGHTNCNTYIQNII